MIIKHKKILLVDDDEIVNYMHHRIILKSQISCEVQVATDGLIALDLLEKCAIKKIPFPDLIFLDVNMPKMDGFEFLAEYAAKDLDMQTKKRVVMLSSSLLPAHRERAFADPNVHLLADKRMPPEEFLKLVVHL